MERRHFLRLAAAGGAAALVLPGWIAKGFAQDRTPPEPANNLATLSAAFREAQRLGKPLLVLVVPVDPSTRMYRARALGELLNHGPATALLDLSLAHVVCASMDDLRRLAPQTPAGEPMMAIVETDAIPARVKPIDVPLTPAQLAAQDDPAIDTRIAALAGAVHRALAGDTAALAARVRVARAHLDAGTLRTVDAATRGAGAVNPTVADRAAALVLTSTNAAARAALLAGATARLRAHRVPGSVWANASSCGMEIEGGEPSMMDCGMGHVPNRSSRFLYFYLRQ